MSRGTRRVRTKRSRRERPSLFFIVILIVGLVLLVWAASVAVHNLPKPVAPATSTR